MRIKYQIKDDKLLVEVPIEEGKVVVMRDEDLSELSLNYLIDRSYKNKGPDCGGAIVNLEDAPMAIIKKLSKKLGTYTINKSDEK